MSRLAAGLWVQAYLMRLGLQGIPVYVAARGDSTAGAILIKLATMDGMAKAFHRMMAMDGSRPWDLLISGAEEEVDAAIARQRRTDPDLWVIEIEDPSGRTLLDEPGLD